MKVLYTVTADHAADAYRLDQSIVEVGVQCYAVGGEAPCNRYSASRARFGYVCDFATPEAAIRDLLSANGCTNIRDIRISTPC